MVVQEIGETLGDPYGDQQQVLIIDSPRGTDTDLCKGWCGDW